jgi:ABC-type lipoprotein release transport system permease subunit
MRSGTLLGRNLAYYWRTNVAVTAGVGVAVAVLAGALLVGDSVRRSLRGLVLERLGATSHALFTEHPFREELAAELARNAAFRGEFRDAVPLLALEGQAAHESSGRRATRIQVFGVDGRFFEFHQRDARRAPEGRDALASPALAAELGAAPGETLILRLASHGGAPLDSLHGRRDEPGRAVRVVLRGALEAEDLGEFSLRPRQSSVRAVFVPLERLQRDLQLAGRANVILVSSKEEARSVEREASAAAALRRALLDTWSLADIGLRLRPLADGSGLLLESDQILIPDAAAETARQVAQKRNPASAAGVFTYLATSIRLGQKEIPYSLVSAVEPAALASPLREAFALQEKLAASAQASETAAQNFPPIWISDWAAKDLGASAGARLTLEYLVWEDEGRLATRTNDFLLRGVFPVEAVSRIEGLAPAFPGISDSPDIADWDPPFPVDLKRVRPRDEDYWHRYRTTPKALLPLEAGQKLWHSRYGQLTSLRMPIGSAGGGEKSQKEVAEMLRAALDPAQAGMTLAAVRQEGLAAAQGAVNFSEYFVYFSFFLVVSAVLLVGLFFRLGVEQRLREVGLLEAIGFDAAAVRGMFLREGMLLAGLGTTLGLAGAVGYSAALMYGLRTWWVGAVGTTALRLHVQPLSLAAGAAGGLTAAVLGVWLTLRSLRRASTRGLLHGEASPAEDAQARHVAGARGLPFGLAGAAAALAALALLAAAALRRMDAVPAFFAAGSLLLAAFLCFLWRSLNVRRRLPAGAAPLASLWQLGLRNAAWRPGRSLLSVALLASATFILVAVDAFRRDAADAAGGPRSGTGGFALIAESALPVANDLSTPEGRGALNLSQEENARVGAAKIFSLRLRPGDDASCLNLYQPRNPRILGVPEGIIEAGRFAFADSEAMAGADRANAWGLLTATRGDGAVPAIVDANSLTYVLKLRLGDEIVLSQAVDPATRKPVRLRIVAALRDSIFQSEVLVSDAQFRRLFPLQAGFRSFVVDAPAAEAEALGAALESALADFGFDAQPAAERLAAFHRVENTYITTFQALGGLGLLLGTLGLAAVLLRNVLERRRELALLRAVGYSRRHLARLVMAENALLLALGLAAGAGSALLAVAPALAERSSAPAMVSIAALLLGVALAGLAASLAAVAALARAPLLAALRAE